MTESDTAKNRVYQDLYNIGFQEEYIVELQATIKNLIWDAFDTDQEHLSDSHIIDDLVENIGQISCNIDHVLQNIRAPFCETYRQITSDIRENYSMIHLVQIIIEYANGRYNPISSNKFLYNETLENTWFTFKNRQYYNATNDANIDLQSLIIKPNHQLFFHATNWENAQSINTLGPLVYISKTFLEFGATKAFYTTQDLEWAAKWARKIRFNNEGAIVIFSIDLDKCPKYKKLGGDGYQTLVQQSRNGIENELDNYSFVYGQRQLASRNDAAEKILHKNIIGTIFLQKLTT